MELFLNLQIVLILFFIHSSPRSSRTKITSFKSDFKSFFSGYEKPRVTTLVLDIGATEVHRYKCVVTKTGESKTDEVLPVEYFVDVNNRHRKLQLIVHFCCLISSFIMISETFCMIFQHTLKLYIGIDLLYLSVSKCY